MERKEVKKKQKNKNCSWKLRGPRFRIVRGLFDLAVTLIFSCCRHRPICCFPSICFNKSRITASPRLLHSNPPYGPGWCVVECWLPSAAPCFRSVPQLSLFEKGYGLHDQYDPHLKSIIIIIAIISYQDNRKLDLKFQEPRSNSTKLLVMKTASCCLCHQKVALENT